MEARAKPLDPILYLTRPTKVTKWNKNSKKTPNSLTSMQSCKWKENSPPKNKSTKKYSNPTPTKPNCKNNPNPEILSIQGPINLYSSPKPKSSKSRGSRRTPLESLKNSPPWIHYQLWRKTRAKAKLVPWTGRQQCRCGQATKAICLYTRNRTRNDYRSKWQQNARTTKVT